MQQWVRRDAAGDGHRYKRCVQLSVCHSRLQSGVAVLMNIGLDLRIFLFHPQHDIRHPVAAYAAEYADVQNARPHLADPHDLLLQALLRLQRIADVGNELFAVLGQPQTIPAADHQLQTQPFLQLAQGMAHRRWR